MRKSPAHIRCILSFSASSRQVWILKKIVSAGGYGHVQKGTCGLTIHCLVSVYARGGECQRYKRQKKVGGNSLSSHHHAETRKVAQRRSYHSRYSCDRFQEQDSLDNTHAQHKFSKGGKKKKEIQSMDGWMMVVLTVSHCLSSSRYPSFRSCWMVMFGLGGTSMCLYLNTKSVQARANLTRPYASLSGIVTALRCRT